MARRLLTVLMGAATLAAVTQAEAASRNPNAAAKAVVECRKIADVGARIACYDVAAAELEAAIAPPTAEEQAETFGTPDEGVSVFGVTLWGGSPTEDDMGREHLPKTEEEQATEIASLSSAVIEYGVNAEGKTVFVLDNGQVWRQTDSDRVKRGDCPAECRVTISKGLIGGYNLVVADGSNRQIKVRRVH